MTALHEQAREPVAHARTWSMTLVLAGLVALLGAAYLATIMGIDVCLGSESDPPRQGSVRDGACTGGDTIEVLFVYSIGIVAAVGGIGLVMAAARGVRGVRLALLAVLPPVLVLLVPAVLALLPD